MRDIHAFTPDARIPKGRRLAMIFAPAAIVAGMNAAIVKASTDPAYAARISAMRVLVSTSTPEEFARQVKDDYEAFGAEIRRIGMDKRWKAQ